AGGALRLPRDERPDQRDPAPGRRGRDRRPGVRSGRPGRRGRRRGIGSAAGGPARPAPSPAPAPPGVGDLELGLARRPAGRPAAAAGADRVAVIGAGPEIVEQVAPEERPDPVERVAAVLAALPAVALLVVPVDLVVLALDLERLDHLL